MAGQNRSSAVMAQRIEPHDSLDYFPTPPWATRALCEWIKARFASEIAVAWDPACGEGHMARPLAEYFYTVLASDVHDYRASFPEQALVQDFLWNAGLGKRGAMGVDWIITNPPFKLAEQFIANALRDAASGVAMLVRTSFLEGQGRYESLFSQTPPDHILQFCERVPMVKGRLDRKASTATSYCWLVWFTHADRDAKPVQFEWIAPCRARLDRDADWPAQAADATPFAMETTP